MINYFLALIPLYIFVYAPLSQVFFGAKLPRSSRRSLQDFAFNNSLIVPEENVSCPAYNFDVHILSQDPLILYLPEFITGDEADHLVKSRLGKPK